jgi:hypothetical protein
MTTFAPSPTPSTAFDPEAALRSVIETVDDHKPYAEPTPAERDDAVSGLTRLIAGDRVGAASLLEPLGFTMTDAVDPVTGRRYAMALSEIDATTTRRWGVYVVDLSAPLGLSVAVPHPRFDEDCELLALRLWRAVPGSILAMATVHRNAIVQDTADKKADPARDLESIFHHLWTEVLGPRGVPQVQIHGFKNDTAPEEVAVSTGVGPVTPAAARIADGIAATGLDTTRSWEGTVDVDLRATQNVQGKAAAANGWVWVHIEHAKSVRDSEAKWQPSIDAVAAANPTALGFDRPAPSGSAQPQSIAASSDPGTSRYFAREDHVHADAARVSPAPITVADADTITFDASRGDYFRITVGGDRALAAPANGTDGQRILVEVLAADADRRLSLDPSILLCAGIPTPVTIPAGKRWFAWLIHTGDAGWMVTTAAMQA